MRVLENLLSKIGEIFSIKRESLVVLGVLCLEILVCAMTMFILFKTNNALADAKLPGSDQSGQLEAAGTLLRIVDTSIFVWGARLFAGLCVIGGAWNLKQQNFGMAVICVIAAIVIGLAPKFVQNIFNIGGGNSIFSMSEPSRSGSRVNHA